MFNVVKMFKVLRIDIVEKVNKSVLKKLNIFNNIKSTTISLMIKRGIIKEREKGEHLFLDKEKVDTIYIILEGKVSLYKISEKGQKKVIFILDKGYLINEGILDDLPASINCEVFEKGKFLMFSKNDFVKFMEQDFILTRNVINFLTIKVRRLYRQAKNSTTIKIEKKLAAKLWKLARDYGISCEDGTIIDLNITVTYLADMLGSARESTSRALKNLEEIGLLRSEGRKIIIFQMDDLANFFKGRD